MSRDFLLQVFSWIIFRQTPENNILVISNFFKNLRRYSQVKIHHRYQRHLATDINDTGGKFCHLYLLVLLIPVANCHRYQLHRLQICHRYQHQQISGTISDCWHLKDFSICHRCQGHWWCTFWAVNISVNFWKKRNGPNGILYSGTWGKLIHEKKLKSKIWCHCPFNKTSIFSF